MKHQLQKQPKTHSKARKTNMKFHHNTRLKITTIRQCKTQKKKKKTLHQNRKPRKKSSDNKKVPSCNNRRDAKTQSTEYQNQTERANFFPRRSKEDKLPHYDGFKARGRREKFRNRKAQRGQERREKGKGKGGKVSSSE